MKTWLLFVLGSVAIALVGILAAPPNHGDAPVLASWGAFGVWAVLGLVALQRRQAWAISPPSPSVRLEKPTSRRRKPRSRRIAHK